jgi:excinuclease ABC subunit C
MTAPRIPDALQRKLDTLPDGPGVYLWKDAGGEILYVGKAKRLTSRVRSYFAADFDASPKNRLLQRLIADVETIVVPSEAQSLILENNLIKEYRPRFNVRLKDDKSYPSIAVTLAEAFPRVIVTRRRDIPGARYYGPYTDVGQLRRTLAIIRRLYTVRSCADDLPHERRERPCLDYHIGRCLAPCVGWQSEQDYRRMVDDVVDFLEGRTVDVRVRVREAMLAASTREDFERAGDMRDALRWLDRLDQPASVEVIGTGHADVVGYARDGDDAAGVLIRVRDGAVVGREHRFLEGLEEEEDADVLSAFLVRYYVPAEDRARRVVIPFPPADWDAIRERLDGPAAGHRPALARAGGPQRAASARESEDRVVRDRGAGGGPGVRPGTRPGAERRAAEPGVRGHLAQPGTRYGGIAGLVRGGASQEERIPEVQDSGPGPAGRLRRHPRSHHSLPDEATGRVTAAS